jgi:hypothetical protein
MAFFEPMNRLSEKYAGKADFLVIYTVEAHPAKPDVEPYSGNITIHQFSEYGQPRTYAGRVDLANKMQEGREERKTNPLSDRVAFLIDDLDNPNPQNGSNPVWCRWGPAPEAGWVIKPDGIVAYHEFWFNEKHVEQTLDSLLTPITV